jgi:hypothetical protein
MGPWNHEPVPILIRVKKSGAPPKLSPWEMLKTAVIVTVTRAVEAVEQAAIASVARRTKSSTGTARRTPRWSRLRHASMARPTVRRS